MIFTTHSENRDYAIKPMNCPAHIQIYNHGLKSYRDLPLRLAEFGSCHRNEPSGTLHGLMRVRNFVQDDAHIFCTEDQLQDEVSAFIDLVYEVYADFGFTEIMVALSTRPEKRVGDDAAWERSQKALEVALDNKGLDWKLQPGEGAFYGPKIDFDVADALGRSWQLATIQLETVYIRSGACPGGEIRLRAMRRIEAHQPPIKQVVDALGCRVGGLARIEIERQLLDAEANPLLSLLAAPGH